MSWQSIGKEGDIQEGRSIIVELGSAQVAVFKVQGKYKAIANICPHRSGPLGEGNLEGMEVTCPWHAWTFDLDTGKCMNIPGNSVKRFEVKLEKGEIWVEI